ncbi:hypothetical protein [Clostridium beijerinckii]|uniref:hypothetical protein n=1 Tax=Clostridium beijerinckii TaxID=1520 RepID=UPI00098C38DA|nr:hypothetical protein [Clostridium beijerinckii]MBA8932913.1 uncharacterized protein with PIN domain [Clostridium beijerinckii]NRU37116.1 uncharacterized protein with PIN domain [Clostridium beijerinckii]NSA99605.1 uncharacterized protein with PIN domain [Clostridium beijerinckii]OOM66461.1 hypothetical protein CLOBI_07040 [Clostridium beijerinckii]OOM72482.1 hypothetical protein CLBEIC_08080 [Clostridium beijerinckii]
MSVYRFNYGFGEFIKILFYKKRCPICKGRIKRKSEVKEYTETDQNLMAESGGYAYNVTIYYICENCNNRVEVSEL